MNSNFESLDPPSRKRYLEKISVIGGRIDPYAIKSEKFDCNKFSSSYLPGHCQLPNIW